MLRRAAQDAAEHGGKRAGAGVAQRKGDRAHAFATVQAAEGFGQVYLLQPLPVVQPRFARKQPDQGARAGACIVGPVFDAAPADRKSVV